VSCTTVQLLHYMYGTAVLRCAQLYSCSTVRASYSCTSTRVAAVLGLYSSAVLNSCTRAPAAELYESCSTAVLVLVLGIPTAVGELTY
jgi:hypothetical protein